MKTYEGNLNIYADDRSDFSDLAEVTGYLILSQGAVLTAPVLAKTGYLILDQGAVLTAPLLAKTGDLRLSQGASLTAPVLAKTGYLRLYQGASLTAPLLAEVTGYLRLDQGASLTAPLLAKTGDLILYEGASLTAPNLIFLPGGVELTVWKKCRDGVIVKLRIPPEAKRIGRVGYKCRAEFAEVIEIEGAEIATGTYDPTFVYRVGSVVRAKDFDETVTTCAPGIHFFLTRDEAKGYIL